MGIIFNFSDNSAKLTVPLTEFKADDVDTDEEENNDSYDMDGDDKSSDDKPDAQSDNDANDNSEQEDDSGEEDSSDDDEYSMDDGGEDSSEGDDSGEEDSSESEEEGDDQGESDDDEYTLDDDGDGGEDSGEGNEEGEDAEDSSDDDEYSMDDGGEDSSEGDDSGEEDSSESEEDRDGKLREIEGELFDSLTPEQKQIKLDELKKCFQELYERCDSIIEKINNATAPSENISKVFEYVNDNMADLKQYIYDYFTYTFNTKSYLENNAQYQKYIAVLNSFNSILEELVKSKESDNK